MRIHSLNGEAGDTSRGDFARQRPTKQNKMCSWEDLAHLIYLKEKRETCYS